MWRCSSLRLSGAQGSAYLRDRRLGRPEADWGLGEERCAVCPGQLPHAFGIEDPVAETPVVVHVGLGEGSCCLLTAAEETQRDRSVAVHVSYAVLWPVRPASARGPPNGLHQIPSFLSGDPARSLEAGATGHPRVLTHGNGFHVLHCWKRGTARLSELFSLHRRCRFAAQTRCLHLPRGSQDAGTKPGQLRRRQHRDLNSIYRVRGQLPVPVPPVAVHAARVVEVGPRLFQLHEGLPQRERQLAEGAPGVTRAALVEATDQRHPTVRRSHRHIRRIWDVFGPRVARVLRIDAIGSHRFVVEVPGGRDLHLDTTQADPSPLAVLSPGCWRPHL